MTGPAGHEGTGYGAAGHRAGLAHDPEPRIKSGDEVTIRRASLGSYLMTIPGRHTYRVQRTQ